MKTNEEDTGQTWQKIVEHEIYASHTNLLAGPVTRKGFTN